MICELSGKRLITSKKFILGRGQIFPSYHRDPIEDKTNTKTKFSCSNTERVRLVFSVFIIKVCAIQGCER